MDQAKALSTLGERVAQAKKYNQRMAAINNALYNYGWAFASAASVLAGFIGESAAFDAPKWVGPMLGVFAAIWIAVDKRLSFGLRWTFHRSCAERLASIEDNLLLVETEADTAKQRGGLETAIAEVRQVRANFEVVPGAS